MNALTSRHRIPGVDLVNRHNRATSMLGPLAVPTRAAFVAAIVRIVREHPSSRLGLVFDGDRHWHSVGTGWELEDHIDAIVTELDADGPEVFPELMRSLAIEREALPPALFVLTRRHVIQSYDHSLGDGSLIVPGLVSILEVAAGGEVAEWWAHDNRGALTAALRSRFRSVASIRALLRTRATAPGPAPWAAERDDDVQAWWPSPTAVSVVYEQDEVRHLKQSHPGGSIGTAIMFGFRDGLLHEGVSSHEVADVVHDVRRFLPAGRTVTGNFVTGIPVDIAGADAAVVEAAQRREVEGARPLAILALGAARRGLGSARDRLPTRAPRRPVAHLTFSHSGVLRPLRELPWASEPDTAPDAVFSVGPMPPEQVSVITVNLGSRVHVTVSFNAEQFDPETVRRALDRAGGRIGARSEAEAGDGGVR